MQRALWTIRVAWLWAIQRELGPNSMTRHYQKRECQAGIQAMSAWRATMLSKSIPNNTPSAEVFDVDDSE